MGHEYWYYLVPIKLEGTTVEEFQKNLNICKQDNLFYDNRAEYERTSEYLFNHAPTPYDHHYIGINTRWLDDLTYCWWDVIDDSFEFLI